MAHMISEMTQFSNPTNFFDYSGLITEMKYAFEANDSIR